MSVAVKICGINDAAGLDAAVKAGARFAGFVFYARSPRCVTMEQARGLLLRVPGHMTAVGLCVDPDDGMLGEMAGLKGLGMVQLHGAESARRAAAVRQMTGMKVMKALAVARAEDLAAADVFMPVVDQLLFDARPPDGGLPGGNALAFDWRLMVGRTFSKPWMLAGGLTPENVAEAVAISGAAMVDVSSGVEDRPGVKNVAKITAFCRAAGARP